MSSVEKPKLGGPARSLIVAPRLPSAPKVRTGDMFADVGDVVADCDMDGCGYHVMGPRNQVKLALQAHHQAYHPNEISVILLNQPRQ